MPGPTCPSKQKGIACMHPRPLHILIRIQMLLLWCDLSPMVSCPGSVFPVHEHMLHCHMQKNVCRVLPQDVFVIKFGHHPLRMQYRLHHFSVCHDRCLQVNNLLVNISTFRLHTQRNHDDSISQPMRLKLV